MSISGPPAKLAAKVRRISGCGSDQVEELFNRDGMPKEERELKDFLKREKLGLLPSPPPFPPRRPPAFPTSMACWLAPFPPATFHPHVLH